MPEAIRLSLPQALSLLRKHLGEHHHGSVSVPEDATPEALLDHLESMGIRGRWISAEEPDALGSVALPTLLKRMDGAWGLLLEHSPGAWILSDPQGRPCRHEGAQREAWNRADVLDRMTDPSTGSLWERVLALASAHRLLLLNLLALSALLQLLAMAPPYLIHTLVDSAIPEGAQGLLRLVLVGTLLAALSQAWFGWLVQRFRISLESRIDLALERSLLSHVLRIPWTHIRTLESGELMQGFAGYAAARELFTRELLGTALTGLISFSSLGLMATLIPAATLWMLGTALVMVAITLLAGRRQADLQQQQIRWETQQRSHLFQVLNGIATFKTAGAERRAVDAWLDLLTEERSLELLNRQVGIRFNHATNLLVAIQTPILLVWGGQQVLSGSLQVGQLLAYIMLASSFLQAMGACGTSLVTLWKAKPYLALAKKLLSMPQDPPRLPRHDAAPASVLVRDLWFRYGPDEPWIFQGLNLEVQPGGVHSIQGPSGFGKSTFLKLLAGLLVPERGSIRIGGRTPEQARGACFYLPQFVQLFNASLLENLRLLSGNAPFDRIREAAAQTGLQQFVDTLPMGYETMVAQGGANFSGGQRQLVALTAVVASECQVLLLDEATANLDNVRRAKLHPAAMFRNKTVLYTCHDPLNEDASLLQPE